MAAKNCHNCVYARVDSDRWLRCRKRPELLLLKCANHPFWPGRLREVPGAGCPNFRPKPPEPSGDVRHIPLGDGHYALVDAADYEWLSRYNWRMQNGYAARRDKTRTTYMHREIMRPPQGMMVDHINHHKGDNRRANLRICTRQQNTQNNGKHVNSSSQFKGVGYSRDKCKWFAKIWFEGRRIWLGYFLDEADAAHAYDAKAVELFGEFAHLNFPDEWPPNRRSEVYAQRAEAKGKERENAGRDKGRPKPKASCRNER